MMVQLKLQLAVTARWSYVAAERAMRVAARPRKKTSCVCGEGRINVSVISCGLLRCCKRQCVSVRMEELSMLSVYGTKSMQTKGPAAK